LRSKIFRGQIGRQMLEVRRLGKFCEVSKVRKFGRSGGFKGRKVRQDVRVVNICIFATSCRLLFFRSLPHRKACP
jgi:hypothetical protein